MGKKRTDRRTDGQTDRQTGAMHNETTCRRWTASAPQIRSRLRRFINLFTYLLTYLITMGSATIFVQSAILEIAADRGRNPYTSRQWSVCSPAFVGVAGTVWRSIWDATGSWYVNHVNEQRRWVCCWVAVVCALSPCHRITCITRHEYVTNRFYSVMPTILFFHRVLINSHHVLQLVLPQQHETQYNLRARQHDRLLIPKTADLNDRDFIVRML